MFELSREGVLEGCFCIYGHFCLSEHHINHRLDRIKASVPLGKMQRAEGVTIGMLVLQGSRRHKNKRLIAK